MAEETVSLHNQASNHIRRRSRPLPVTGDGIHAKLGIRKSPGLALQSHRTQSGMRAGRCGQGSSKLTKSLILPEAAAALSKNSPHSHPNTHRRGSVSGWEEPPPG